MKKNNLERLQLKANWVWQETVRIHYLAPETRVASSLSPVEILTVLYYGGFIDFFPNNRFSKKRDRVIISKGHGSLCMYPILADLGFFSKNKLKTVCQSGSFLGGIPDPIIPGYETINGSLGHGIGVSSGIAIALKKQKISKKVFVLVGDGELHEGSNWEAIMLAGQLKLNNLVVLLDNNKISMLDKTDNIINHRNLPQKMREFGWETLEVKDGHSVMEVYSALNKTKKQIKPQFIIFNTNKGNKVPKLENLPLSHVIPIDKNYMKEIFKDE